MFSKPQTTSDFCPFPCIFVQNSRNLIELLFTFCISREIIGECVYLYSLRAVYKLDVSAPTHFSPRGQLCLGSTRPESSRPGQLGVDPIHRVGVQECSGSYIAFLVERKEKSNPSLDKSFQSMQFIFSYQKLSLHP